jgi:hypothetical protein
MATLLKVLNNLADIKSAGGVALGLGTQAGASRRHSPSKDLRLSTPTSPRIDGFAEPRPALVAKIRLMAAIWAIVSLR